MSTHSPEKIFVAVPQKVDAYFEWVRIKYTQVAHNSATGKALAYSINQEKYLRVFLDDGDVPMDNNLALCTGYFYPHLLSRCA